MIYDFETMRRPLMKQILGLLVAGLLWCNVSSAVVVLKSETDKLSYSIGVMTGRAFKAQSIDIKPKLVGLGLQHGYAGNKTLLSDKEVQNVILAFQKQSMQRYQ